MPTGWSSVETSKSIKEKLEKKNIKKIDESKVTATGYVEESPFPMQRDKTITEITRHGKGTSLFTRTDATVTDIGGSGYQKSLH